MKNLGNELINFLLRNNAKSLVRFLVEFMYYKKGSKASIYYDECTKVWHFMVDGFFFCVEAPGWERDYNMLEKRLKQITCFKYLPRPGDIVVDLGAGLGEECLILSKFVGESGKLFAFEAHPRIATAFRSSVNLNKLNNIELFNVGASDVEGEIELSDNPNSYLGNSVSQCLNNTMRVQSITLDRFIEEKKLSKISFLKINIEGAEKLALKGLAKHINIVENIAVSCHDFRSNRGEGGFYSTKSFVVSFLERNNFKLSFQSTGLDYVDDWVYGKRY